MIDSFFLKDTNLADSVFEGDIYKVLNVDGKIFEIKYGYYEEIEKNNPAVDPMPIYPDFSKKPIYTKDGFPFVTKMQDACVHYKGKTTDFKECAECVFFRAGDDLIGVCTHEIKRKKD